MSHQHQASTQICLLSMFLLLSTLYCSSTSIIATSRMVNYYEDGVVTTILTQTVSETRKLTKKPRSFLFGSLVLLAWGFRSLPKSRTLDTPSKALCPEPSILNSPAFQSNLRLSFSDIGLTKAPPKSKHMCGSRRMHK